MTKQNYNGWTNYETWNLKLWIDNGEGSQRFWTDQAQEIFDASVAADSFTRDERAALQDALEKADAEASWIADFLHAAISEVNWYEIAASFVDSAVRQTQTA